MILGARYSLIVVAWLSPVESTAAANETARLPTGSVIESVDFDRHVAPLLGRLGCNGGSCHGSFQGRGGFRLSLFGHSPEMDYHALTRGGRGRRVNVAEPDRSLMLLKPTQQLAHGGGRRLWRGSWEYGVIREWIAQGARRTAGSGEVSRIVVSPPELVVQLAGDAAPAGGRGARVPGADRMRVIVEFTDGTQADLTPFCEFRPQDDSIVEVSDTGELRPLRPGDTAVIVSYRGHIASARVLVPAPGSSVGDHPASPRENFIDEAVFAKLERLNIEPSRLCSDAEFLRRVTIDAIGSLPAPGEVRAFLGDDRPDKRLRKIDELLAHPLHAALWATRLCDITGNNLDALEGPDELKPKRAKMWHDWFRRRIAEDVPWCEIVRGVLCATSRREDASVDQWIRREADLIEDARAGFDTDYAARPALDLYWRRHDQNGELPLEETAERTAAALLGVRIECARCHKHPFDRWTQADYRSWANVFSQVRFGSSPELRAAMYDLLEERRRSHDPAAGRRPLPRVQEVYLGTPRGRLRHPQTNDYLQPKALGGPVLDYDGDARRKLFAWLVAPGNPYFACSFVNRVWAHYFGVGLVEPVDAFSVANPPSNERLLQTLADEFRRGGWSIRRLERLILSSRTYQLSAEPNDSNRHDRRNFSRSYVRPLMAEAALDVLNTALGVREEFGLDAPPGVRAVEVAPSRLRNGRINRVFQIFGRPPRTTACDCERASRPTVPQSLMLMCDERVLSRIASGRLQRLLAADLTDAEIVAELFLATLSRFPNEEEKQTALAHLRREGDRHKALADVMWALINTREFITNH